MSKEAMKLALEALEKLVRFESDSWELGSCRVAGQAIKALREALAEQPAQQEPVVFYRCNGCGHAYEQVHPTSCDCMEADGFDRVEYYTYPPVQQCKWPTCQSEEYQQALAEQIKRELVGEQPAQRKPLTDEEWQSIADTLDCSITRGQKDAIEAALGIKGNT